MNGALDRLTNDFVPAESRGASWGNRICAECRQAVIFAGGPGKGQVAHFRHRPKNPRNEKCSLYLGGVHADARGYARRNATRLTSTCLCFQLRPSAGRGRWQLLLRVPKFSHATYVEIGSYSPNPGRFPVKDIPVEGYSFSAYPQAKVYKLDVIGDRGDRGTIRVEGLGEMGLFVLGPADARQVREGDSLEWGSAYALVQQRKIELGSFPDGVPTRRLAENDGWHATLFGLPAQPNPTVAGWIAETMGRSMREPPVAFTMLSPIASRATIDGWVIPTSHRSIIVAARLATLPRWPITFVVVSQRGVRMEALYTPHDYLAILDLGALTPGIFELRAEGVDVEIPTLRFEVRDIADYVVPSRVILAFETEDRVWNITLWDCGLVDMFAKVRAGQMKLAEVRLPEMGTLVVARVSTTERTEERFSFGPFAEPVADVAPKIAARLRDLLASASRFEVQGDGFGNVCFPPAVAEMTPTPLATAVPQSGKAERDRRAWIELALNGHTGSELPKEFLPHNDRRGRFSIHVQQFSR